MIEITTDCRTDEGITVGLIDSLITICRVLRERDLSSEAVKESVKDLLQDNDFLWLYSLGFIGLLND